MAQINFASKQINCKIVYYGPGMCGKTTNLLNIHDKLPEDKKTEMTSIATEGDRTLFFDFLPLDIGTLNGMQTKFHLYTVPGQVYYDSTRKLVLQGADGIVFVADSQKSMKEENIASIENLRVNLEGMDQDINDIPLIIQYNKRDLDDIMDIEELQADLNKYNVDYFEAIACKGEGVYPTLKAISQRVIEYHSQKINPSSLSTKYSSPSSSPSYSTSTSPSPSSSPLSTEETNNELTENKNIATKFQEDYKPFTDEVVQHELKETPKPILENQDFEMNPLQDSVPLNMETAQDKAPLVEESPRKNDNTKETGEESRNIEAAKQYRSLVYNKPGEYKNLALKKFSKKCNKKESLSKKILKLFKR